MNAAAPQDKAYPSPAAGWFLVIVLFLAYVLSFVDRFIIGLLVQPIKAEFHLDDSSIGWLLSAFTLVYGFVGIFMGWMIDRWRRLWIVSIGVAAWSVATVATGMAKTFPGLFAARMGVGIGEATLSPAAFSMIADSFPPEKRGKPIALYSAGVPLGSGVAALLSGAIIAWAAAGGNVSMPLFGELSPWRFTLIAVGLPGILLAVVFLFMHEPVRRGTAAGAPVVAGSFGDAMRTVRDNFALYAGFVLAVSTMTAIAYSHQFLAATFERTWGWKASEYAFANGIALLVIAPVNMAVAGILTDRWSQKGVPDAALRYLYMGFLVILPTAILPYFLPTGVLAFTVLCLNTIGIGMMTAVSAATLLPITPAHVRGQMIALYYLAISMLGSLGPIIAGQLSSKVFGEAHLGYALACVPVIMGVIPLAMMPATRRRYLALAARLKGEM